MSGLATHHNMTIKETPALVKGRGRRFIKALVWCERAESISTYLGVQN
jgi:hypothetical protein